MSKHTTVRIKGSPWEAVAHRRGSRMVEHAWHETTTVPERRDRPLTGEEDMLLDLAVRHFDGLDLTSSEANEFAAALLQVASTGQTVSVFPASSTRHAYEISRHVAAVTIRFGQSRLHLPLHAALQLADALGRLRQSDSVHGIAA